MPRIRPCLWFDAAAEEAARFYCGIFPRSRIGQIARYPDAGQEVHGMAAGTVLTVEFELDGQPFIALNGGPQFTFSEAISLEVSCADQAEVDYYWDRLGEGGDPEAQQCGWLKDRFGLSWQITPEGMSEYLNHPDGERSRRAFEAMLGMKKLDLEGLRRAVEG